MKPITRDSHFVPRRTLQRWSEDGTHVWAYRLLVSHPNVPEWQKKAIKGLTQQRDLYTTFAGNVEGDEFEVYVTRDIEEPGQEAIERLIDRQRMTPVDFRRIALFVAAQQLRTPLFFLEFVRGMNRQLPETLNDVIRDLETKGVARARLEQSTRANYLSENLRVVIDRPSEPDSPAEIRVEVSSSRAAWLATVRNLLTNRADVICSHHWRRLEAADDGGWPLTDHPALTLNYHGAGRYDFGAGWGKAGSEFILPISPRLALYTQVGSTDRRPLSLTAAKTAELKKLMVERSLRWILMRKPESWVAETRPRVVDSAAFAEEQNAWANWNDIHASGEREFGRGVPDEPANVLTASSRSC